MDIKLRKRIVILSVACILALCICILFATSGMAVNTESQFSKTTYDAIEKFFQGNQLQEAADIMLGTNSGFLDISNILGMDVSLALQGFGAAALLLNMFVQAGSIFISSRLTKDVWLRYLAQFVFALTAMIYFNQIMDWICIQGSELVTYVKQVLEEVVLYDTVELVFEKNYSSLGAIGPSIQQLEYITSVVPSILVQVLSLFIKIVSYAIFFEMVMRRAFVPLAIAGILSSGPRSSGIRFFKKFIGLFLRMLVVLISIATVWGIFLSSAGSETIEISLIDSIGVMLAANIFISKGSRFTDSLIGM